VEGGDFSSEESDGEDEAERAVEAQEEQEEGDSGDDNSDDDSGTSEADDDATDSGSGGGASATAPSSSSASSAAATAAAAAAAAAASQAAAATASAAAAAHSSSAEQQKSGIPDWARGHLLAAALEKQFGGADPINPDSIFSEFFTCDLQRIFDTKKKRYVTRSSSGNWLQDRLTLPERLAYQKAMGYKQPPATNRSAGAVAGGSAAGGESVAAR
jgi:Inner centromere protein, ARK binding region